MLTIITLYISNQQDHEISSLIQDKSVIYIACGNSIKSFKRGKLIWSIADDNGLVTLILITGEYLVTINSNNIHKIWNRQMIGGCGL